MKKKTIALIALLAGAGTAFSIVIYSNNFNGADGSALTTAGQWANAIKNQASKGSDLGHMAVSAYMNGSGQLVSGGQSGHGFRVDLTGLLTEPDLKITWTMTAPTANWVGIGFAGSTNTAAPNQSKLNDNDSLSGPWIHVAATATVLHGGVIVTNVNDVSLTGTHLAGNILTYELVYHTDTQTVDLFMTNLTTGASSNLFTNYKFNHTDTNMVATTPVPNYLFVQLWAGSGALDNIIVEVIPEPASALIMLLGAFGLMFARRFVNK